MAKDKPITSGSSSKATPVVKSPTKATNLFTQKIQHELLVDVLQQTANTLEFSANVLPSGSVDPRYNNGRELVKIADGSVFSGVYLVTEMTTTYSQGRRERTLNGLGHAIDGSTPVKLVDTSVGKASSTLGDKNSANESNPSGSKNSNDPKNSKPVQSKSSSPSKDMYYKDGKWYNV